nr:MAG TPA: hypothetical protein [Caudoviricetes sp.]
MNSVSVRVSMLVISAAPVQSGLPSWRRISSEPSEIGRRERPDSVRAGGCTMERLLLSSRVEMEIVGIVLGAGKLVNQNPQLGFGGSLGDDECLVASLHQFNFGSVAKVMVNEGGKVSHSCCHVGKRMFIVGAGNPALVLPAGDHLACFELTIKGSFIKEPVDHRLSIARYRKCRTLGERNPQGCQTCCQHQGLQFSIAGANEVQRIVGWFLHHQKS